MIKKFPFPIPRLAPDTILLLPLVAVLAGTAMLLNATLRSGSEAPSGPAGKKAWTRVPFIENRGELATDVRYYANTFTGTVFITGKGELVYALPGAGEESGGWVMKETLLDARRVPPLASGSMARRVHAIVGDAVGRRELPEREQVNLSEVYPGIELGLKAYGNNVQKLFTVRPGGRPEEIRIAVSGAERLRVNGQGELEIATDLGPIRFAAPIAYQMREGERAYVPVTYRVQDRVYGFEVGHYDPTRVLIIGPRR